MNKVNLIQVVENDKVTDLICGNCHSLLYGYDEVICPCCGAFNDADNPKNITKQEADKLEQIL